MLFYNHDYFFQSRITGSITETINGAFNLAGPCNDSRNGISSGEAEVILAMTGNNGPIDIGDMFNEIGNFFSILMRKAIAGCVRYVNDCCAGFDYRFHNPREISVFGPTSIFRIKLNIPNQVSGPCNSLYS